MGVTGVTYATFKVTDPVNTPLARWSVSYDGGVQPQVAPPSQRSQVAGPLSSEDYLELQRSLLPYGPAWTDDPSAAISRLLDGLAQEMARIDARAWKLIDEADPRTASELFEDWLRVVGLPDACTLATANAMQSADQLQAALISKFVQTGGQTAAYYQSIARAIGLAITITEFLGTTTPYKWQVNAPVAGTYQTWAVNQPVNLPLAQWGHPLLECTLQQLKPAHTTLVFSYL